VQSVWKTSILFTIVTTVLLAGYPLFVTGIAAVIFPHKAAGSLITLQNGTVIGSELIARVSHPTSTSIPPSAAGNGYDATASGGSNLAQSNKALVTRIQGDIDKLAAQNPGKPVPSTWSPPPAPASIPTSRRKPRSFRLPRSQGTRIGQDQYASSSNSTLPAANWRAGRAPRQRTLLNLDLDKMTK